MFVLWVLFWVFEWVFYYLKFKRFIMSFKKLYYIEKYKIKERIVFIKKEKYFVIEVSK